MKEAPAPWHLHLPGAVRVQRACICSRINWSTKKLGGNAGFHGLLHLGSTAKLHAALAPLPACWLGLAACEAASSTRAEQFRGRYAAVGIATSSIW